jgi:hypothetical protein
MTTKRKVRTEAELFQSVKFTQLAVRPWTGDSGDQQSSIIALGDDGNVYQYYHSEKAWVPYSTDILRRV